VIEAPAVVVATEGLWAYVRPAWGSECSRCCASGGCGAACLGDLFGIGDRVYRVVNSPSAVSGDRVVLGVPDGVVWIGCLAAYLLPLAALLCGALLGVVLAPAEGRDFYSVLGAGGGLLAGFGGLVTVDRLFVTRRNFAPSIMSRYGN
jgi:sigma-E factor negative regulatory protein RseC